MQISAWQRFVTVIEYQQSERNTFESNHHSLKKNKKSNQINYLKLIQEQSLESTSS